MNIIFFDSPDLREALKPFTLTRPASALRVGILTLQEKWQKRWENRGDTYSTSYFTEAYLQAKFALSTAVDNILVNAAVCPSDAIVQQVSSLRSGQRLVQQDTWVAAHLTTEETQRLRQLSEQSYDFGQEARVIEHAMTSYEAVTLEEPLTYIQHTWDIFSENGAQIEQDYALVTQQRTSRTIDDPYTRLYGAEQIFIEEGATVRAAIINAESGPVYLGKNATVHENAVIKGPFAMLEESHVNIGSKIREATTIGPYCKVGGEVKNSVFLANSNKGHEGFVGNSVVGEWCNFGADSNTSNLKNNYQSVRLWHYGTRAYEDTHLQFCGLMMGDHSKCSINTMFNTGTVVGVFANIFGTGFPAKFVPSFSWGGIQDTTTYQLDKALEVYERVLARKGLSLTSAEANILTHLFENRNQELPT